MGRVKGRIGKVVGLLLILNVVCAVGYAEEVQRINRSDRRLLGSAYGIGARIEGIQNATEEPKDLEVGVENASRNVPETPEPTSAPEPSPTPEPDAAKSLLDRFSDWIKSLLGLG